MIFWRFVMSKLISIIVPIYNVEYYLERCLDSILKQTFFNYDLIVIIFRKDKYIK